MRKLFALMVVVMTAVILFDGCKKGPEDPFLSFKSRKKRVEGYWRVTELLYNNVDSLTHTTVWDTIPTTPPVLPPCVAWTTTFIHEYRIKFRFDGDGRYEKDSVYRHTYQKVFQNNGTGTTTCENIDTLNVDSKVVTKGFWMFAGATGDIKNKERMFLTDGEDQYSGRSYDILKCSDKEMKLVYAQTKVNILTGEPFVEKIQYNLEAIDADEYQNDSAGQ